MSDSAWVSDCGTVQLYLGDCLEVLPTLAAGSVDAVVTDPPYGIGFAYASHDDDAEQYSVMLWDRLQAAEQILTQGYMAVYQAGLRAKYWATDIPRDWRIIVLPVNFTQGGRGDIVSSTDFVLWWRIGERRGKPKDWQEVFARNWFICDTSPAHRDPLSRGHPCPRSTDGTRYLVQCFTKKNDTVLDLFLGSGTTGVACVKTGRKFIGIEIDPGYFEIAKKRIAEALLQTKMPL